MPALSASTPKFSRAIVRTPCENIIDGLTSVNLGEPDYWKALMQHRTYIEALEQCQLEVTVLPPDERYPDSTFVEDTALLTTQCAIITNPGAASRKGETCIIFETIDGFFDITEVIDPPGTIEAGDIMMVGQTFYIGLSQRTNVGGANQMIQILQRHGMKGIPLNFTDMLHLKTGVSYLENNVLVMTEQFVDEPEFKAFDKLVVEPDEAYAACSLWINDKVLVPADHPKTKAMIESSGYQTIVVDTSEFQKIDGGLSCLSLRF